MSLQDLLFWQLRGTIVIGLGYFFLAACLRRLKIESPTVRLAAVLMAFIAAYCPWSLPVQVEWYPMPDDVVSDITDSTLFSHTRPDDLDKSQVEPPATETAVVTENVTDQTIWPRLTARKLLVHSLPLIWLAGLVGLCCLTMWRYLAAVRQANRPFLADPQWVRQWHDMLTDNTIARQIPLLVTRGAGPLLGLLPRGYCLLVPQVYWQALEPKQRCTVLRHELEHYLRGDVPASALLRLLALPFWFHPLVWRLVGLVEEATEWACDRAAAGEDSVAYAQALERLLATDFSTITPAMGRCAQTHPLVTRVRRVLHPLPAQDTPMKTTLFAAALAAAALLSFVQIRLVAQEKREATLETVKEDVQKMQARLEDLKASAEQIQRAAEDVLEVRVKEKLAALKALAENPSQISADGLKRVELLKSGEEAKQLEALSGAEKLGDEGLLLRSHAAKEIDRESVRRKALTIACSLGDDDLPIITRSYEALPAKDRLFLINELAKQKDKVESFIFAQLAQDGEEENRVAALKIGLTKSDPLVFLILAINKNEEIGKTAFPLALSLKGEDLELFLFAFGSKGPEELLPQVIKKAVELKDRGYPAVAAAYKRNVAAARGEIVRQFRKSTVPIEQRVVEEALKDEDADLRAAAEAAKNE